MRIEPHPAQDTGADAEWDSFVLTTCTGTLLHTRRFLGYHGDAFADRSVRVLDDGGRLLALLPAALDPADSGHVVSHPGATYGGLLLQPLRATPGIVEACFSAIIDYFGAMGLRQFTYKTVPEPLHTVPFAADRWALRRMDARSSRGDLWNVQPVLDQPRHATNHRQSVGYARKAGVTVVRSRQAEDLRRFYEIVEQNLADNHGSKPTHSLEQLLNLSERLGEDAALWCATDAEGELIAGVWVLHVAKGVWHTQYIAASPAARSAGAGHLVVSEVLGAAHAQGMRVLSFGASTEQGGTVLNAGLFEHKLRYGGGSYLHEHFTVAIGADVG